MSDEIKVRFTGDQTQLKATVGQVKAEIAGIKKVVDAQKSAIADVGKVVGGVTAAMASLSAGVSIVAAAMEKFGRVQDITDSTGMSPEFLQRVGEAAEQSSVDISALAAASAKLSKEIVFGKDVDLSTQALKALGYQLSDLKNLSPEDQFSSVASAIGSIENPTQQTAAALAVFGRNGAALVPVFKAIADGLGNVAVLSRQQIADIDKLGDQWTHVKNSMLAAVGAELAWTAQAGSTKTKIEAATAAVRTYNLELARSGQTVDPAAYGKAPFPEIHGHSAPWANPNEAPDFIALQKKADAEKKAAEDKAAADKKQAGLDQLSQQAAKNLANEALRMDAEIARNEQDTAKTRHDNALAAMDDEGKLQALTKERGELIKKYTGEESRIQKSVLDKMLADKDEQIANLQRSMASKASSSGGSADSAPAEPTRAPDEMRSFETEFRTNPANFNEDGSVINGGALRMAQLRDRNAGQRENRRRTRGLGSTPRPNPDDVRKNVGALFDKSDGMDRKRRLGEEAMGDGSKPQSGSESKAPSGKTLDDVYDVLNRRLPKKSAKA